MAREDCVSCQAGSIGKQCKPIGTKVQQSGGKWSETYTFFQCTECGAVWMDRVEEGMGGHGHQEVLLTKGIM